MIQTTKQANIARAILYTLSHQSGNFTLRSVSDLLNAVRSGVDYSASRGDVVAVAQGLGLVQKRRKSDGEFLFGLKEKVDAAAAAKAAAARAEAERVARERREAEERARRQQDERLDPNYEKKSRLREALQDTRWTFRTYNALAGVSGLTVEETKSLLGQMTDVVLRGTMAALRSRA